jgi:DNA-directed RNA polymerase specialized sigma24 family protein
VAARFVQAFIERLDDKQRELFTLVMLEAVPVPEVAKMLSIPLNTAYTRLRSARLLFQAALKAHGSATP